MIFSGIAGLSVSYNGSLLPSILCFLKRKVSFIFEEFACLWGCVTSFCETNKSSEAFSLTGQKNIPIFSEIRPTEALPLLVGELGMLDLDIIFFVKKCMKIDRERLPQWR